MKRKYTKWIKMGAALLFAVLCLLITYNDTLKISFLPTWETLFDGLGAEDDTPAAGSLTVDMLDVGNADALVLQSDGKTLLIDAGENGDGSTVLAFLQENGIERLDYVIATHADSDHIGGMRTVVEQMPIGRYIMAFMPQGSTRPPRPICAFCRRWMSEMCRSRTRGTKRCLRSAAQRWS